MATNRWGPMSDMLSLREAMERLLQESFERAGHAVASATGEPILLDLADAGDRYLIHASLSGVQPSDVDVSVQGETLTIRGERKAEEAEPNLQWLLRERRAGTVERTVALPGPVDVGAARASYENGVLTLSLPKAAEAQPRRIRVGGAEQRAAIAGASCYASASPAPSAPLSGSVPAAAPNAAPGGTGAPPIPYDKVDPVDEQSMESFPASDPPSWTPERT